jgi:hypothetical protein
MTARLYPHPHRIRVVVIIITPVLMALILRKYFRI